MVDSTPQANVQALRALFAQRNDPVMGIMQAGSRLTSTRNSSYEKHSEAKITKPLVNETSSVKSKVGYPMGKSVSTSSILTAKSNLFTKTNTLPVQQISASVASSGSTSESSPTASSKPKPILGPKPTIPVKPVKSLSSSSVGNISSGKATNSISRSSSSLNSRSTDSIASGNTEEVDEQKNFNNASETITESVDSSFQSVGNPSIVSFTVKLPYEKNTDGVKQSENVSNVSPKSVLKHFDSSSVINSENYICKANLRYRRKLLPPVEKLGNPPLKAPKPLNIILPTPDKFTLRNKGTAPPLPSRTVLSPVQNNVPELPQRPKRLPPRPPVLESTHPVTSQPHPVPAIRRKKLPVVPDSESNSAEELYEDTIVNENSEPTIPEYTDEQEAEDELYDDTDMEPPPLPSQPPPSRPKYAPPPPPPPSGSIGIDNTLGEELYQDAMDQNPLEEDLYEEMPADTISNDEANGPMYSNRKEELRFKKEEEKQRRKEQKEKEKKDRELEKLRKKYLITGDELPVDTGVVKCDSRGGRLDLAVKKGDILEILRMENNPSGKWLVRNDRAKIGYVELTNIQVDANSIKSVMVTRASMQNLVEELYNDAETEEALYEETF
ncbi:uncharacterized protein LOC143229632 isoform X2 [Tachypleus tridentatus]